ncbi:MAG: hypothetical protein WAU68_16115 [Vitreimonas sp.]
MDMHTEFTQPVRFEQARPLPSAPSATAPYDVRAGWSRDYVTWFILQMPQDGALPPDVRDTHRFEIEFEACVMDPQSYERQTLAELRQQRVH